MKKFVVIALAAIAVAVGVPSLAIGGGSKDATGPSCANIVNGGAIYFPSGTVTFTFFTETPTCKQVNYTLYVLDSSGNQIGDPVSVSGDGTSGVDIPLIVSKTGLDTSAYPCVKVYVTSSAGGGNHAFDRAPNTGFSPCGLDNGIAFGFAGWN